MSKHEKDVQGVALYLEFRRSDATAQILVTPDGLTGEGTGVINAKFFRRVLTQGVSKRKWRAYSIGFEGGQSADILYERKEDYEKLNENSFKRFSNLGDYFDSLARNGYTLVKDQPIYVEATKEDLLKAAQGNLSTKLWNRVKSSRVASGFPDEIIGL